MTIFYFTATGNSLEVAKALGGKCVSIAAVMKGNQRAFEDDVIGIITPNHYSTIPSVVADFIKAVKLKADYRFGIITYGNLLGAAPVGLSRAMAEAGQPLHYTNYVKMADNFFELFSIELELKMLPYKKVPKQIAKVKADIEARKQKLYSANLFEKVVTPLTPILLQPKNPHKRFRVEKDKCISCGTCAKVCPIDNVEMQNGTPLFHDQCILCGACTHNCPKNAIRYRFEVSKARFRNAAVSLGEMFEANNTVEC